MADELNVTTIKYGSYETDPVWQWSYGQQIRFEDFGDLLPSTGFEVHFANPGAEEAEPAFGTADGVTVPNEVLENGNSVVVWVFLHEGVNDGETRYEFVVPIVQRAKPPDVVVPPEQETFIEEVIAALQVGVADAEAAADSAQESATAAEASAASASASADAAQGYAERAETAAESAEESAASAATSEGAAQGYASAAAASATSAGASAQSAESSADRAEQAAADAGYMDMNIDADGYLCYVRTPQVSIDFALDENGYLVMGAV